MSSQITLSITAHDYPKSPTLGVLGTDERGRVVIARTADLNQPHSTGQFKRAASALLAAWFEPELYTDGTDAVHRLFESLTSDAR